MNRNVKILFFSLLLVLVTFNKHFSDLFDFNVLESISDTESVSFIGKSNKTEVPLYEEFRITYTLNKNGKNFKGPNLSNFTILDGPTSSSRTDIVNGKVEKVNTYTYRLKADKIGFYNIDPASIRLDNFLNTTKLSNMIYITVSKSLKSITRPISGFSPYNSYYGKGVYSRGTDNSVKVTAPKSSDIVFLLKNIKTRRTIRTEYIRANSEFILTDIPYGKYKFYYLYGKDWSPEENFKGGVAKGNFLTNKRVSKSDETFDFDFQEGYYGTYEVVLQLISNGNLETVSSNENEL